MNDPRLLIALAAGIVLSSCADSSDSGAAGYSSKDDALAQLSVLYSSGLGIDDVAGAPATTRASQSGLRAITATPRGTIDALRLKATQVVECGESGTASLTDGSKTYTAQYLDFSETTSYELYVYDECVSGNEDLLTHYNGSYEVGYGESQSSSSFWGYEQPGADGKDITVSFDYGSYQYNFAERSLVEYLGDSEQLTLAGLGYFDQIYVDDSGAEFFIQQLSGADGTPFVNQIFADESYLIAGAFGYSSSVCKDGLYSNAETLSPLRNGSGGFPLTGELRLFSGQQSMTIEFNGDATATVTYSSGGSDLLSADELASMAYAVPEC